MFPNAWLISCASVWTRRGLIVSGDDERAAAMRLQVLGDGGHPLSAEGFASADAAGESDAQRRCQRARERFDLRGRAGAGGRPSRR